MRRAGPPRYFQEDGDDGLHAILLLRGELQELEAVCEVLRRGLEVEGSAAGGALLDELTTARNELREYRTLIDELDDLEADDGEE